MALRSQGVPGAQIARAIDPVALGVRPVAERLVYRKPMAKLKLSLKPDKDHYAPGEKASVLVTATDDTATASLCSRGTSTMSLGSATPSPTKMEPSVTTSFFSNLSWTAMARAGSCPRANSI